MTLTNDHIYHGRGFADQGNYNTLVETTVRHTVYIANTSAGDIMLKVTGTANDPTSNYHVHFGELSQAVTGQQLTETEIGPFPAGKNEIIAVTITLADPNYKEEDSGLILDNLRMYKE